MGSREIPADRPGMNDGGGNGSTRATGASPGPSANGCRARPGEPGFHWIRNESPLVTAPVAPGETTSHWKYTDSPSVDEFSGIVPGIDAKLESGPLPDARAGRMKSGDTRREQPGNPTKPRSSGRGRPAQLEFERPIRSKPSSPGGTPERWILKKTPPLPPATTGRAPPIVGVQPPGAGHAEPKGASPRGAPEKTRTYMGPLRGA